MDYNFDKVNIELKSLLFYLPSCIYLNLNQKLYHLSHGAFDVNYCGLKDFDMYLNSGLLNLLVPNENNLKKFLNSDKKFDIIDISVNHDSNQYKWGDFDNSIQGYRDGYHGRSSFGTKLVKKYLEDNNIEICITGHQDSIPIGFLMDSNKNTNSFSKLEDVFIINNGIKILNNINFEYCPDKITECEHYRLYSLSDAFDDSKNETSFSFLTDNKKILALVTSTALFKGLEHNCYLILQ